MDESLSIPTLDQASAIDLATKIVAAYVSNNSVPAGELSSLLTGVHAALNGLGGGSASAEPKVEKPTPAQIRKSITPDALISFIDGKPYKTLKRHLSGNGMTIEEYRERYGLPRDYPATAASYSAMRSEFARSHGLGRQRRSAASTAVATTETVAEAPKVGGRRRAAEPADKPVRTRKPRKAEAGE